MALTEGGINYTITLIDAGSNTRSYTYKSDGDSVLQISGMIDKLRAAFGALSNCAIKSISARYVLADPDFAEVGTGEVEESAKVKVSLIKNPFPQSGQNPSAVLTIPGPVDNLFIALTGRGRNIVDPANADLITFIEAFEPGLILPAFTLSDYQYAQSPTDFPPSGYRYSSGGRQDVP